MKGDKKWRWLAVVLGYLTLVLGRVLALRYGFDPWVAEGLAILAATVAITLVTVSRSKISRAKLEATGRPIEFLFRPLRALSEAVMLFFAMVGGIFLIHHIFDGANFDRIHLVGFAAILALLFTLESTAYEKPSV